MRVLVRIFQDWAVNGADTGSTNLESKLLPWELDFVNGFEVGLAKL